MQSRDRFLFDSDAEFENVKAISSLASVRLLANSITDPAHGSYEYQTSALGITMFTKAFQEDHWIFAPEARFGNINGKRPDLVVQMARLSHLSPQEDVLHPTPDDFEQGLAMFIGTHLIYEAKAQNSSDRLEDALAQVVKTIPLAAGPATAMYIVIQRGLSFAFFEYYHDKALLDHLRIPHFRGCVPITAEYENSLNVTELFFPDAYYENDVVLLPLFHDFHNLRAVNAERTKIREEAGDLVELCVFNFREHAREIDLVLHRMSKFRPRAI